MLDKAFVPIKPFSNFKWQWACVTCTEGLNDPVVLLGVLQRMRKLEPLGLNFSSHEFANEMDDLTKDVVNAGLNVDLRSGARNLIRNSGQYWKAVRLIPSNTHGKIELTDFGRKVASHQISQDTIANGFAMRVDIHTLFDTGHLRISPDGDIDLSPKARNDYGTSLPRKIFLPDFTNRDFLRWRWENYAGI